jgi:hypothetical protein
MLISGPDLQLASHQNCIARYQNEFARNESGIYNTHFGLEMS